MKPTSSLVLSMSFYCLLRCFTCTGAEPQIPAEAKEAWEKNRISLLSIDPVSISSSSFSARMDIKKSKTVDGVASPSEQSVFVAKLGADFLISTTETSDETRVLLTGGKFYEIRRPIDTKDWILVRSGDYVQPESALEEPFDNTLFRYLQIHNERLLALWSLGNSSFTNLLGDWQVKSQQFKGDILEVIAEPRSGKTIELEFDSTKEFCLKKRTDKYLNSGVVRSTAFSNISEDFLKFSSLETGEWEKDGVSTKTVLQIDVAIDDSSPKAELFDLSYYNLAFSEPLANTNYSSYYLFAPLLLGIVLILISTYLKRRS